MDGKYIMWGIYLVKVEKVGLKLNLHHKKY